VIYSPEIPGPRPGEARDEWEIPILLARHMDPEGAAKAFPWKDTSDIREEIDRICPAYRGIGKLQQKGDSFQYGGPRLLADGFATPSGKGAFSAVELPQEQAPKGKFVVSTRRGKQFNSIVHDDSDPLTGALRDDVLMAAEDAARLALRAGDTVVLRNEYGRFRGRVKIDRIKPGSLQVHWPEGNVLIPSGRLDESGAPDYNAVVEVSRR
jgi:predicted molibdopterin-dependent oxidoreductase YjgC